MVTSSIGLPSGSFGYRYRCGDLESQLSGQLTVPCLPDSNHRYTSAFDANTVISAARGVQYQSTPRHAAVIITPAADTCFPYQGCYVAVNLNSFLFCSVLLFSLFFSEVLDFSVHHGFD